MFALCFASVAAADLRRVQVRKTTRKSTNRTLKAVRIGLAAMAVILAATGTAMAGGKGKSGGNGGNGGSRSSSSFRIQSTQKFSQSTPTFKALKSPSKSIGIFNNNSNNSSNKFGTLPRTTLGGNNFSTPKNFTIKQPIKLDLKTEVKTDHRRTNPWNPTIDKKIGGLNGVVNKKSTILTFPANKKIADAVKDRPFIHKKIDGIFSDHGNGNGNGKAKCHDWDWCWKQHCKPCYKPCQTWHCWNYPKWNTLYRHRCGYYVNVPVIVVHGIDLQLLAVRFVDNGDPAQNLGPRFRVWVRNNTAVPMVQPFNVLVMAARDVVPTQDLPQAGVRIEAMQPGQILPVDIRLPVQANDASLGMMHVLVDSHREVAEVFEDNNGIVLPRAEILPVDPALLAADVQTAVPGAEINLAGEGLGAAAGQVIVKLAGLDMPAEVLGWSELGIQIRLPSLPLVNPVDAQIIAIRGDGKAIRPLPLKVVPGQVQISTTSQPTAVQAMFGG